MQRRSAGDVEQDVAALSEACEVVASFRPLHLELSGNGLGDKGAWQFAQVLSCCAGERGEGSRGSSSSGQERCDYNLNPEGGEVAGSCGGSQCGVEVWARSSAAGGSCAGLRGLGLAGNEMGCDGIMALAVRNRVKISTDTRKNVY